MCTFLRFVVGAAIVALLSVLAHAAHAANVQFSQQGQKLVGARAVGPAGQGFSVALSANGNTAIAGGRMDNGFAGAAWIFTRSGDIWSQQGDKLFGSGSVGSGQQGTSVALSADGNTAIVGAPTDNGDAGAVWIYIRSGSVWSQQGAKLVGTGAIGTAFQGVSVALSADGNTAIVGGPDDNTFVGAAWVYTRSGGVWNQQGTKLVGSGGAAVSNQGNAVALSADGNTAIVGGNADNLNVGAVWVYTRSSGVWSQQGSKLVGTGAVGTACQGISVGLSGDGNTAIVGGWCDNTYAGAAWVFTRTGTVWSQQGTKLVGTGASAFASQGYAVALSADGNSAIVGGHEDNGATGALWVYTRSGGVWSQEGTKLVGTGAVGTAGQGYSVALSADGNTALAGGWGDNGYTGAVWVYAAQAPGPVPAAPIATLGSAAVLALSAALAAVGLLVLRQ